MSLASYEPELQSHMDCLGHDGQVEEGRGGADIGSILHRNLRRVQEGMHIPDSPGAVVPAGVPEILHMVVGILQILGMHRTVPHRMGLGFPEFPEGLGSTAGLAEADIENAHELVVVVKRTHGIEEEGTQ